MTHPDEAKLKEALEPCPFCGKSAASIDQADDELCYVFCGFCLAEGPNYGMNESTSPDEAATLWNTRQNAWKAARFDAMRKAEAEGEIAIVPVEPTEAMRVNGGNNLNLGNDADRNHATTIFKAMIRAVGPSRYLREEGEE